MVEQTKIFCIATSRDLLYNLHYKYHWKFATENFAIIFLASLIK